MFPFGFDFSGFEQASRWGQMWLEMMSRMMSAGLPNDANATPADAARKMRDSMLDAMSRGAEQFMRSPEFLDMLRQSSQARDAVLRQVNDTMTRARHGTQGVAKRDVEDVSRLVRHAEQRLLDRIEDLGQRLEQLVGEVQRLQRIKPATPAKRAQPQRAKATTRNASRRGGQRKRSAVARDRLSPAPASAAASTPAASSVNGATITPQE